MPALLGLLALVTAVFVTTPVTDQNGGFDSDARHYASMAGESSIPPVFAHAAPWCWRVLTPALAAQLPWTALQNFRVLAFASDLATLALLYLLLRALGYGTALARIGVLFYGGVFWALKFSFYSPAYIDHQTQLFLVLILYLSLRRWWAGLIPVLALAALQKESLAAFAVFPVALLWRSEEGPRPTARTALTLAMIAAPLAALVMVRRLVPGINAVSPVEVAAAEVARLLVPSFWPVLVQSAFSGLGVLPALLLLHPGPWVGFLRREWEWAVYALVSLAMLFGGIDKSRLFLYFLPLAVILALRSVDALTAGLPIKRVCVWALTILPLHFFIGGYLTPMGSFLEYLNRMVPEHSAGGFLRWLPGNLALATLAFALSATQLARPRRLEPASFEGE